MDSRPCTKVSVEFPVLNYDIGEGEFEEFFLGGGELGGEASLLLPQ